MAEIYFNEEQKKQIVERYRNYEDIYDIAESFYVSVMTIRKILKEMGVSRKRLHHNQTYKGLSR